MHNVPDPERLEQLRASVTSRLARVCGHLPPDEYDALVLKIATVTLRYEQRPRLSTPMVNDAIDPPGSNR